MKKLQSISPDNEKDIFSADYNLRVLVCILIKSLYDDLVEYIKRPYAMERHLYSYGYKVQYLIEFWEKDAAVFLSFLYGSEKASKILERLNPQIKEAKRIYEESLEFAIKTVAN